MPPERTAKKNTTQTIGPLSSSFDPSQEGFDDDLNPKTAESIRSDPFRKYVLKTGYHAGRTLEQIADGENGVGYLRWMITNPKARKGIDDEHIIRKALKQWNDQAGNQATVWPSTDSSSVAANGFAKPATTTTAHDVPARFKDLAGELIWICGGDIIGLFHMQPHQLQRFGVQRDKEQRYSTRFSMRKFPLYQVYDAAKKTPGCPLDETPEQALERYLKKVEKCGKSRMSKLSLLCECKDCRDIRCGATEAGENFWHQMMREHARIL